MEKNDNKIWIITAVVALAGALFMVRSGEHGNYESSAKPLEEAKISQRRRTPRWTKSK